MCSLFNYLPPFPFSSSLLVFVGRSAEQPDKHKEEPAAHDGANARDPRPGPRNRVAANKLIVREMPDGNGALLVDVSEERALVVDTEVEDAVLIGKDEACAVDGRRLRRRLGGEVEAMEGGQHGELELHNVVLRGGERGPGVPVVLREGNGVVLPNVSHRHLLPRGKPGLLTTSFLTR